MELHLLAHIGENPDDTVEKPGDIARSLNRKGYSLSDFCIHQRILIKLCRFHGIFFLILLIVLIFTKLKL